MSALVSIAQPSVRDLVSEAEWQCRVDLAACYRLAAHFGWIDLIYTHISARVPDNHEHFLLNPFGFLFEEVTASSLVKLDLDGGIVMDTPHIVNAAGFTIHSAVHQARPEVDCVMHTHTVPGMAVSAQQDGLLPLAQISLMFYENLSYHDYEGIAFDLDERERLINDLGSNMAMILRNHGLLTCGRTISGAFTTMHALETACSLQIAAQSGGGELVVPPAAVCRHTARQFNGGEADSNAAGSADQLAWSAMLRLLDRVNPGYDA